MKNLQTRLMGLRAGLCLPLIAACLLSGGCGKGSEDKTLDLDIAGKAPKAVGVPAPAVQVPAEAAPPAPPAQPALAMADMDFDQLNEAALKAENDGRVREAEDLRIAAVNKAKTIDPLDFHYTDALRTLGFFYHIKMGDVQKAEDAFLRLLKAQEQIYGTEDSGVADTLIHLTSVYNASSKFENSLPLYQRAIAIREKIFGKDDPRVAEVLGYYAGALRSMGREAEAKPLDERRGQIMNGKK
ncbi:tetratricopeptide repeat protein [Candidatus Sumerlaeota bacterium]|nr:tetratricopeptide repeat protein [Candidatus Sumerlaeota bacterium]